METCKRDMATSEMKPLVCDLDYYAEAYRAYAGFNKHKLKLYGKWRDEVFIPSVMQKLQGTFQGADELKVLGIGSGGGEIDICLLEAMSAAYTSISNTVIEPSSDAIRKYTALLQEKEALLEGFKTFFKQTTMQEFCAEVKNTTQTTVLRPKFHFIHAIQSLYYASDLKEAVTDMYEMLEEGGAMLIIMMTDEHVLYRMWDRFPFHKESQEHYPANENLSSKDVTSILKQLGLPYILHTVHCRTDASACFDPDSKEGSKILDFLTNTIRFRESAPFDLCEKVLQFLHAICSVSRSEGEMVFAPDGEPENGNQLLFDRDWQSIIVFR